VYVVIFSIFDVRFSIFVIRYSMFIAWKTHIKS
jgi:hypothetical protein